jgi:hypothetical protein
MQTGNCCNSIRPLLYAAIAALDVKPFSRLMAKATPIVSREIQFGIQHGERSVIEEQTEKAVNSSGGYAVQARYLQTGCLWQHDCQRIGNLRSLLQPLPTNSPRILLQPRQW